MIKLWTFHRSKLKLIFVAAADKCGDAKIKLFHGFISQQKSFCFRPSIAIQSRFVDCNAHLLPLETSQIIHLQKSNFAAGREVNLL